MTWYTDSANQTAAAAAHVETIEFVRIEFPSDILTLHTRLGTIVWGGYSWLGVGTLGGISDVTEDAMLRPAGLTLSLSGIDTAIVQAATEGDYHGYPVSVFKGLLDPTTHALVADPQLSFRGLIDRITVELSQGSGVVTVHCEGELARWDRHQGLLFTNESQKSLFPGDKGFDRIPIIQNRTIDWTKKSSWGYVQARIRAAALAAARQPRF